LKEKLVKVLSIDVELATNHLVEIDIGTDTKKALKRVAARSIK